MSNKDWDYIARVERAVKNKYGEEAVTNPRSTWDETKEESYNEQRIEFDKKLNRNDEGDEKVADQGFLISKKLIKYEHIACCVCKKDIFKVEDDITILKFNCCYKCYVNYVEGREQRWQQGWRPNTNEND